MQQFQRTSNRLGTLFHHHATLIPIVFEQKFDNIPVLRCGHFALNLLLQFGSQILNLLLEIFILLFQMRCMSLEFDYLKMNGS